MAVVRFPRKRRRISLRHYICTEAGPFKVTSRLARELAHREVAVPKFANSVQRMVEVFVETVASEIRDIQIRPTHARFDQEGNHRDHSKLFGNPEPLVLRQASRKVQMPHQ